MKVIIVEDEQNVRKIIQKILETYFPELEIIGCFEDVESTIEGVSTLHPDLVLMDIEIKGGTGFDVLERVHPNFKTIFVTAHEHYAIKAIKLAAIDYVLKPVESEELRLAVQKAIEADQSEKSMSVLISNLQNPENSRNKQIILKDANTLYFVMVDDIIRCEAEGKYTTFFQTSDPKRIVVSTNLKEYEKLLAPYNFIRCHNSHLVNMNYVSILDKNDLIIILKNKEQIPVSTRKRREIFQ